MIRQASRCDSQPSTKVGEEDADCDGELVGGDETAAQGGRRQLGGVERRGDGGHTDPGADDQPPRDQDDRVGRQRLHEGAQGEYRPREQYCALAADPVGQLAGSERAEQRAERDPARHHFDHQRLSENLALMPCSAPEITPWS